MTVRKDRQAAASSVRAEPPSWGGDPAARVSPSPSGSELIELPSASCTAVGSVTSVTSTGPSSRASPASSPAPPRRLHRPHHPRRTKCRSPFANRQHILARLADPVSGEIGVRPKRPDRSMSGSGWAAGAGRCWPAHRLARSPAAAGTQSGAVAVSGTAAFSRLGFCSGLERVEPLVEIVA